jgi:hypothetical protein
MAQNGETFQLIRGATTLDISDLVKYHVIEFDGFGMSPVRRLTQRGPLQNGDTDVGFRLDPRTMRISVQAYGTTAAQFHSRREELLQLLKPGTDAVKLCWTLGDGTQRQIDCHISGGLSLGTSTLLKNNFRDVIELRASDPTWYDPNGGSLQFAQTGGGTPMPVPVLFPLTFGASTLNGAAVINLSDANAWDTFPIIYVTGPVTGLILTNTATGDKLDFTGATVGSGVTYTIDLRYGYKTVIDSTSTNRISQITSDSNIATWRLVPGANSITATGTSIDANTRIYIQYNTRFIGV